jgi:hypothetical protein
MPVLDPLALDPLALDPLALDARPGPRRSARPPPISAHGPWSPAKGPQDRIRQQNQRLARRGPRSGPAPGGAMALALFRKNNTVKKHIA